MAFKTRYIGILFFLVLFSNCACDLSFLSEDLEKIVPPNGEIGKESLWQDATLGKELLPEKEIEKKCQLYWKSNHILFGAVKMDSSKIRLWELQNTGEKNCVLQNANFKAQLNQFRMVTSLPVTDIVISPHSSISFEFQYAPTTVQNSPHSAEFSFQSNDKNFSKVSVSMEGTTGAFCLEAFPVPLDFGTVQVGCKSNSVSVEIYHVCQQENAITLSKIEVEFSSKEFLFVEQPKLPHLLPYGTSARILMEYKPQQEGKSENNLLIRTNFTSQPLLSIPLEGKGSKNPNQLDEFIQQTKPEMDLLFVIDNSCSMAPHQTSLSRNLNAFLQWTQTLQVDYHIGVTTTDTEKEKGCLVGNSSPKYITPNTPKGLEILEQTVLVGVNGHFVEKPLEASEMALSPSNLSKCNKGFIRKDASLSIVYITDEEDSSPNSVEFYFNFLQNVKGKRRVDKLRVSAIGHKPRSFCLNGGICKLYGFSESLRGVYDYIYSQDWGKTLSQLGSITFGFQNQFYLSRTADAKTMIVKIEGKSIPQDVQTGWSYDSSTNSILFANSVVPKANEKITVEYQSICRK